MVLTGAHYIYLLFMILVLITMIAKKESVVPCTLGVFALGLFFKENIVGALGSVFNAYIVALNELGPIILIVGVMAALSKALEENKAIDYMVKPASKLVKTPTSAFFVAGICMLLMSWFFWPTPATALIGVIFLPIAIKSGLPAIGLAMAINLFGHGIGLSTDFIIQAAPSITATSAGISVTEVINEGMILYIVMGIVTVTVAYIMLMKDIKRGMVNNELATTKEVQEVEISNKSKISVFLVIIGFILDIVAMYIFKLAGGEATALLGGTAVLMLIIIDTMENPKTSLNKVGEHIVEGLLFGIRVFGIIIPIAAFFYMGDSSIVKVFGEVLQPQSQGLLADMGIALSNAVPFNKFMAASLETIVGVITGLDGSGFSGMSLAGSLAVVFDSAIGVNLGALAALGQIAAIWVGGGCLVPWSLVVAAAICGVHPLELAKRNLIPVVTGLTVTTIVAMFII